MKKSNKKIRKARSSFKSLASVKKEVALLEEWATKHSEVEFILPFQGASIKYMGRIVDISSDDGTIPSFQFVSRSGVQAMLIPQSFEKCSVEKIEGIHNGIYISGKTKNSQEFSIVEFLLGKKPNAKLPGVLEKLRAWQRLNLDLHVVLSRGSYAISFLGQAFELSSGVFSFKMPSSRSQLMVSIGDYKHMKIHVEEEKSSITLFDPQTEEWCLISDAATRPETVFQKFFDMSSKVH